MPVKSLRSSVLVWPRREQVESALSSWSQDAALGRPDLLQAGYFGSYARGEEGVGSDLDVVLVVERSALPKMRRSIEWKTTKLPVPVDLLVFTRDEWDKAADAEDRFTATLRRETVWVYRRERQ